MVQTQNPTPGLEPSSARSPRTNAARALLFLASLAFFGFFAFALGEWFLSSNRERIRRSDKLDANLVQYDSELGWALTPGWQGAHAHHDFNARYSVDSRGFRADSDWFVKSGAKKYAVFGDSFVFGFGVNNDQTFVHLLDRAAGPNTAFINCAVPGYSTDQESLYMERVLPRLRPDVVVLVVYLGNDLFDNQLPSPLQVRGAKPYFTLDGDGSLSLHNFPAPLTSASKAEMTLSAMVLGPNHSFWQDLSARSELLSQFGDLPVFRKDRLQEFSERFAAGINLFWSIAQRAKSLAERNGARLQMVVLGGKSFVETPQSISGQYQEALRQGIVNRTPKTCGIIDLATTLQNRYRQAPGHWFFENDGHFNALGHQVVATILQDELAGVKLE